MAIRSSGYFNNPQFAQAAANLGALFAPPSGADAAGWANANAKNADAARLAQLFSAGTTPSEQSALVGVQNYGATPQGFNYQVDQGNATARRGQDVGASTSIANNTADNQRALIERRLQEEAAMQRLDITDATARYGIDTQATTSRFNNDADNVVVARGQDIGASTSIANNTSDNQRAILTNRADNSTKLLGNIYQPLNQGQVAPAIDPTVAAAFGYELPAIPQRVGAPKPLNESEFNAAILGQLPPQEQRAAALGSTPVENVVTPEGPRTVFRADAVGQQPYFNNGTAAKPQNAIAVLPGGAQVPAVQGADNRWVHAQTGQPLPDTIKIFDLPKATGTAGEIGMAPTVANTTQANNQEAEVSRALRLLDLYEGSVRSNPGALGLSGLIRGTAQNAAQTAQDLARSFGGDVPQVQALAEEVKQGLQGVAPQLFDPAIPEQQFLQGTLAYSLARTENPSGEVSRQAYERALERVQGGGWLANSESAKAAINTNRKVLQTQLEGIRTLRAPGTGRTDTTFQDPGGGTTERWERDATTGKLRKVQ